MDVSPGETRSARKVGVAPGETCAVCGCFPGERIVARKTGIPQPRRIVNDICMGL